MRFWKIWDITLIVLGVMSFDRLTLRELPANSPFRLDPLEAGLMMASAGQANISSARGGF